MLIPHWIEYKEEHASEFVRWSEADGEATPDILAAVSVMANANSSLATALEKLGGTLDHPHPHDHPCAGIEQKYINWKETLSNVVYIVELSKPEADHGS